MNKRLLLSALALPLLASPALTRERATATFNVPHGVSKLRIRSYREGKKVIDTVVRVKAKQTFVVEAVD